MKIITKQVKETINFAKKISHHLKERDVLALTGELGSGKTVFAKGLAFGLGIKKEKVISPSFVLMQEYKTKFSIYHFDLYRVKDLRELYLIGFEEYLDGCGVSIIEWADRARELLPKEYLLINFRINNNKSRTIEFKPHGPRYINLIKLL
ncbi:MAG: tRNA (adenosine(37)-N6)-threonylcarbamoyltransferase complex ATPase subunit type 1 TsaE [Candidatus Omnitrophota bacterium]